MSKTNDDKEREFRQVTTPLWQPDVSFVWHKAAKPGIERVGSRLWWRSCSILLSRKMRKYFDNKKNRCKKTCDSKPLSHSKNTEFPIKAQLHAPDSAPTVAKPHRDSPLNWPVGGSKFFLHVSCLLTDLLKGQS